MKIIPDLVTADEISSLKQYWQTHSEHKYLNWQMADGRVIDHRLQIIHRTEPLARRMGYPTQPTQWDPLVDRVIHSCFTPASILGRWAALQRQTNPHCQHIDDWARDECERDHSLRMYTFIVALDTIPEFKTIVWKEGAPSNEIINRSWPRLVAERKSRISEQEDLEHIPKSPYRGEEVSLADFLTLDGIFSYQAGWGCLFNGKQLHTTSNWLKYPQHTHRDLLQIHLLTEQPLDDWQYYAV